MANFLDSINKTINTLDSLASVETAKIDSANTVLDSLNTRPMYEQSLEKQPLLSNIYINITDVLILKYKYNKKNLKYLKFKICNNDYNIKVEIGLKYKYEN